MRCARAFNSSTPVRRSRSGSRRRAGRRRRPARLGTPTPVPSTRHDRSAARAPPPPSRSARRRRNCSSAAQADYTLGQYDLAIAGFEAVIKYFPRAERAADAQVNIGHSYLQAGKNEQAVEAYDAAIRNYPDAPGAARGVLQEGHRAQEPETGRTRRGQRSSTS